MSLVNLEDEIFVTIAGGTTFGQVYLRTIVLTRATVTHQSNPPCGRKEMATKHGYPLAETKSPT